MVSFNRNEYLFVLMRKIIIHCLPHSIVVSESVKSVVENSVANEVVYVFVDVVIDSRELATVVSASVIEGSIVVVPKSITAQ